MTTEYDYTFDMILRARKLEEDIHNPPPGTDFLTEKRVSELQAATSWKKTGKDSPTTGDKAIIKYYPLPRKPTTERLQGRKNSGRKREMPRILAKIALSGLQTLSDGTPLISDRKAWNQLPEVAMGLIKEHIHCEATTESRRNATLKLSSHMTKFTKDKEGTITFKQFAKAWENQKSIPEKRKEAAEKKKAKEEAREAFIRKGVFPK